MERVMSATEARIHFGELMRQVVEKGETVIVERGGKAHVVILSIDEYERLVKGRQGEDWQELVARARAQIEADLGGEALPAPEEILRQVREERDAQHLALP
jgi:prevent-host-death family protein